MCEIFPEVETCCTVIELRLGVLFIAVFSVMTGALGLVLVEQKTDANFGNMTIEVLRNIKNITELEDPIEIVSAATVFIPLGIAACSALFVVCGFFLIMGNLWSQEGFVQAFVWLTFLNVLIGYLLIVLVGFDCVWGNQAGCLLGSMDWLSGAAFLVATFFYLCLWVYFIIVANSLVLTMVT